MFPSSGRHSMSVLDPARMPEGKLKAAHFDWAARITKLCRALIHKRIFALPRRSEKMQVNVNTSRFGGSISVPPTSIPLERPSPL